MATVALDEKLQLLHSLRLLRGRVGGGLTRARDSSSPQSARRVGRRRRDDKSDDNGDAALVPLGPLRLPRPSSAVALELASEPVRTRARADEYVKDFPTPRPSALSVALNRGNRGRAPDGGRRRSRRPSQVTRAILERPLSLQRSSPVRGVQLVRPCGSSLNRGSGMRAPRDLLCGAAHPGTGVEISRF
jgi:hypothetical protein